MSIYSALQNKSISMSMDLLNSAENWLDQGISLYPNYTAGEDFTHLFMRSDVAQIQSLLHTPWMSPGFYIPLFLLFDQTTPLTEAQNFF